jgi:hypothetical protein
MYVRIAHQLMCFLHICPLQPTHNWSPQVHLLHDVDQALGNVITSDDTPKDVDEYGRDFGIARDQVKGILDRLWRSATSNVKEVGRRAAVQLDDVHSGHGEASTIYKTSDVAIELNKVKARPILESKLPIC